jgi:hypothetical protein
MTMINIFAVDTEDYLHPTEVGADIEPGRWTSFPSRVERNSCLLLDMLAEHQIRATFFGSWLGRYAQAEVCKAHH